MAFLKNIVEIANINWGSKYCWDVMFDTAPSPFNKWFPAVDVNIEEAIVDTLAFDLYNSTYEIPAYTSQQSINITFYDDENFTLFFWLKNWVVSILNTDKNGNLVVSNLETSVRSIHLLKLNSRREIIKDSVTGQSGKSSYLVFPKMTLLFEGDSSPEARTYTATFVIAGEL